MWCALVFWLLHILQTALSDNMDDVSHHKRRTAALLMKNCLLQIKSNSQVWTFEQSLVISTITLSVEFVRLGC